MRFEEAREELGAFAERLPIVSTHEHHQSDEFFAEGLDLAKLFQNSYVGWSWLEPGTTRETRARFLDALRANTYYVWLERGLERLYDFERPITAANWDEISERIASAHRAEPDRHIEIMKGPGRYLRAIQDTYDEPGSDRGHPELFATTYRINMFMYSYHEEAADHNGNNAQVLYGERPKDLGEFVDFLRERCRAAKRAGAVALKSATAYERDLSFEDVSAERASEAYGRAPGEVSPEAEKAFGDYVFHRACEAARELGLVVQVHTGLGLLAGSEPMRLRPVLAKYPDVKFDLFHGGYPWTGEVGALAHNHANAMTSLVWLTVISTSAAERALAEWLDVAQRSTAVTWGGDAWTGEESYSGRLSLERVVANVLARKVAEGYFDMDYAKELARKIFWKNAAAAYGIKVDEAAAAAFERK